jgi:hypothetical protein
MADNNECTGCKHSSQKREGNTLHFCSKKYKWLSIGINHACKHYERWAEIQNEQQALKLLAVSGCDMWTDDKVIDFVNWFLKVHNLDFRYTLENRNLIDSFKNGDDAEKWHCH